MVPVYKLRFSALLSVSVCFSNVFFRLLLYCNVAIGQDLKFEELLSDYDAVVLAYGASKQRELKIPGVDAKNVFSGGNFVSWYNGLPITVAPLLDCEDAVTFSLEALCCFFF